MTTKPSIVSKNNTENFVIRKTNLVEKEQVIANTTKKHVCDKCGE